MENVELGLPQNGRSQTSNNKWNCFGSRYQRQQIVFFTQIILVYLVAVASLINLSFNREPTALWITLLSSSVGYLMPSPTLKQNKNDAPPS